MCSEVVFSCSEFGNISPELNAALQAGFMGMFIGACYGGIVNSKVAYTDFMERNEATVFKSHFDAKVCGQSKEVPKVPYTG
jgi:hypothetical protein